MLREFLPQVLSDMLTCALYYTKDGQKPPSCGSKLDQANKGLGALLSMSLHHAHAGLAGDQLFWDHITA